MSEPGQKGTHQQRIDLVVLGAQRGKAAWWEYGSLNRISRAGQGIVGKTHLHETRCGYFRRPDKTGGERSRAQRLDQISRQRRGGGLHFLPRSGREENDSLRRERFGGLRQRLDL